MNLKFQVDFIHFKEIQVVWLSIAVLSLKYFLKDEFPLSQSAKQFPSLQSQLSLSPAISLKQMPPEKQF